jgi:hypothetical protein
VEEIENLLERSNHSSDCVLKDSLEKFNSFEDNPRPRGVPRSLLDKIVGMVASFISSARAMLSGIRGDIKGLEDTLEAERSNWQSHLSVLLSAQSSRQSR